MKIGGNLLNLALTVIPKQSVEWFRDNGKTTNEIGLDVTTFVDGGIIKGSFQPVPRDKLQELGLDYNKSYCNFFVSTNMIDLTRDKSGDQFVFAGERYQVISNTEWFQIDGWNGSMAVKLT